jgi:hypothetical protein
MSSTTSSPAQKPEVSMRVEQTTLGLYMLVIDNVSASLIGHLREKLTDMLTERTAVTWHFPIASAVLPKIAAAAAVTIEPAATSSSPTTKVSERAEHTSASGSQHGEDDEADEEDSAAEEKPKVSKQKKTRAPKEERRGRKHAGKREVLYKDFGTWLLSAARDPEASLARRVREEGKLASGKIVIEAFLRWSLDDGCRRRPMSDVVGALQTHLGLPQERFVAKAGKDEDMPAHARELETLWSRHLFHRAARLGKTVAAIEPRHYGKNIRYYSAQLVLSKLGS